MKSARHLKLPTYARLHPPIGRGTDAGVFLPDREIEAEIGADFLAKKGDDARADIDICAGGIVEPPATEIILILRICVHATDCSSARCPPMLASKASTSRERLNLAVAWFTSCLRSRPVRAMSTCAARLCLCLSKYSPPLCFL